MTAEAIDFPFDRSSVVEGAESTNFSFELQGELKVTQAGVATLHVRSDDSAELFVDGRRIVDNRGSHEPRWAEGDVALTEGSHRIEVRYQQYGGGAYLRAELELPGQPRRVIGKADVPDGFRGHASYHRREIGVSKEAALAHLRGLRVRYIVQTAGDSRFPMETQLGLRPLYEGSDVRLYEVPQP
jgi:hypothetical protein